MTDRMGAAPRPVASEPDAIALLPPDPFLL
ncbi:MAG: hypothetical protein JWR37_1068, partial [Mycobacterium sp.]|nr:hypothetical protein [Mycobacterium sp.]